ncbi:MAG: CocE/NonD family hydrolase [Longimicrobiales bacterium]
MIRLAIRQSRQGPGRIPRRPGSGRNLVRRLLPATFTLLVVAPSAAAAQWPNQEEHAAWVRESYRKTEQMVAMRDGTRLFTIVYQPVDTSRTYPVMLFRTPYSIGPYGPDEYREVLGPSPEFDGAGYIFVFQDVRGQFQSEGEFEVIKPLATSEELAGGATDESTDNYDTIEWVLANVAGHNGRVGQWGISYPGWQTVMGMVRSHPALVAVSPQASPADMFIGDDWHHNGAFRIMYAFSWLAGNARRRDEPGERRGGAFDYGTPWGYRFFLEAGSAAAIDREYFGDDVPAWRDFIAHPNYDEYWQGQNALAELDSIRPAVLNVAGWFDTEDFYGPMSIYRTVEKENPGLESVLAVGPWLHGGWRSMEGDVLGCIEFGRKTSRDFQRDVQFPFFEHHLRDAGEWNAPEATVFLTGTNEWRVYDAWPPAGVEPVSLYLGEDGSLSFEAPTAAADAADSWTSDPNRPVPFSAEIRTTLGHLWMVEDQRFAATRPDVMVYESAPLEEDLTIAGEILAELFVSTTGTDADWIVKLIDVYPGWAGESEACEIPMGGFQMLVAGEIMRGRYRDSFAQPSAMVPEQVTPVTINLRAKHHTFRQGHRIMIQVQSTWFPAYDRNPQSFEVDPYTARPEDYHVEMHTVHRSAESPSRVVLPVMR